MYLVLTTFKRSKEEVEGLMELARQKFLQVLQKKRTTKIHIFLIYKSLIEHEINAYIHNSK